MYADWTAVSASQVDAKALLGSVPAESPIGKGSLVYRDYWFSSGSELIALCRSRPPYGCFVEYLEFKLVDGVWTTDGMPGVTVCT